MSTHLNFTANYCAMRIQSFIFLFIASIIIIGGCKEKSPTPILQQNQLLIQEGKEIVMKAQSELGKKLMKAIQTGGPQHAVSFCSDKALSLTDSLGSVSGVSLKRVSDKNRNPLNVAKNSELKYIENAKVQLANGEIISPSLVEKESGMVGYYPILTNELCIQCHGSPHDDIQRLTMETISDKYPQDKATGYGVNELRGIWVVEFNNK